MSKLMLVDAQHQDETRVVVLDHDTIEDFDFVTSSKAQLKGNIYLAKITRVEPSLQAAFVEYGGNKQGFLPFSEIHPDYYQIPVEDRQRLIEEELEEAAREEEEEEAAIEQQEEEKKQRRGRRGGRGRRRRGPRKDEAEESQNEEAVAADAEEGGEEKSDDEESSTEYQAAEADNPVVASEEVAVEAVEEEEAEPKVATGAEAETASEETEGDSEEESSEDEAETVSADDSEETQKQRKRGSSFKRYRIQEVIKRNQIVLVQVIKEERGNKGCSLTTYISLAGRYCVLMPNSAKGGGVSRKISNGEQRKKLKEILAEMREKRGFSAIIRTAGTDRTKTEIKRDYEYLVKLWSQIREDTLASTAPSLIYEESDIIKRSIRDVYTADIEQVMVQGEEAYKDCKAFMKLIMPSHAPRVKQYKEAAPIFASYGVEDQLASMHEPEVKMPSGGYIVLQQTEALISIDVNSGRSTTERNVEETAIKTNLEAAKEVARQLRLRDLAGIVVVDFIDMYYGKNRRTLERAMKDALKHDRAKIQVSRISPFGLIELSRQRLRPSIVESSTQVCPVCNGVGTIKSKETLAIQIIRLLEREAVSGDYVTLKVLSRPDVVLHLLNEKRPQIQDIESAYNVSIVIELDVENPHGEFRLFKTDAEGKEALHVEQDDERARKRKSRGRRGGRGRRRHDESREESREKAVSEEVEETPSASESDAQTDEQPKANEEEKPSRRRRSPAKKRSAKKKDESEEAKSEDEAEKKPRKRASTRRSSRQKKDEAASDDSSSPAEKVVDIAPSDAPASSGGAVATADVSSSEDPTDADRPKRKGWWNRIVEGADS